MRWVRYPRSRQRGRVDVEPNVPISGECRRQPTITAPELKHRAATRTGQGLKQTDLRKPLPLGSDVTEAGVAPPKISGTHAHFVSYSVITPAVCFQLVATLSQLEPVASSALVGDLPPFCTSHW